jgi:hypothetical protein
MYRGTANNTEFNSVSLLPKNNKAPFQFDSLIMILSSNTSQSHVVSFLSYKGTPKYLRGKEETIQPSKLAN